MNSEFLNDKDANDLCYLPFMTLKYPKGEFTGSRTKYTFILIPPDEIEIETMILQNGGQVLTNQSKQPESEYAITILCERFYLQYPEKDFVLPLDTFSSVYIHDAIENFKKDLPPPNLSSYRITQSKYHSYKPEDVLWQHQKWSSLVQLARPTMKKTTAQLFVQQLKAVWKISQKTLSTKNENKKKSDPNKNSISAVVGPPKSVKSTSFGISKEFCSFTATTTQPEKCAAPIPDNLSIETSLRETEVTIKPVALPAVKRRKRTAYRRYTRKEGQKMLDLICEKKAFMYTKGIKIFQLMELSKHFPGRTCQSLKGHWKKIVHPRAIKYQIYDITPFDLDLLIKAEESMKWNRHRNICPDYEF